jgi:hypothetical protein
MQLELQLRAALHHRVCNEIARHRRLFKRVVQVKSLERWRRGKVNEHRGYRSYASEEALGQTFLYL